MTAGTRVLIVEDNPIILLDLCDQLAECGYHPIPASSAASAARLLDETISALVTDIELGPGPDGLAIARLAAEIKPMPIVVVSGGVTPSRAELPAHAVFLPKPYSVGDIAMALDRQSLTRAA